jgi:hypothetical protein
MCPRLQRMGLAKNFAQGPHFPAPTLARATQASLVLHVHISLVRPCSRPHMGRPTRPRICKHAVCQTGDYATGQTTV